MTIPGIIDPPDCDKSGVPLDWERCRDCYGKGRKRHRWAGTMPDGGYSCERCDGHGSLKAAALATIQHLDYTQMPGDIPRLGFRCEDCGHPMSEGTWEFHPEPILCQQKGDDWREQAIKNVLFHLRGGFGEVDPRASAVHYSPCDEGCRHGGPGRVWEPTKTTWEAWPTKDARVRTDVLARVEASWRPVDVRTLGWPHDLRPEKLAVLCLRCYAERP